MVAEKMDIEWRKRRWIERERGVGALLFVFVYGSSSRGEKKGTRPECNIIFDLIGCSTILEIIN